MSDAIAIALLLAMLTGWVAVQRAWARCFPESLTDPDVLAGRRGCDGCGCASPCGNVGDGGPGRRPPQEKQR
ncbi:MAG: hypothetical protein ACQGVK_23060 [Myxococcota bacterium]